MFAREKGGGGCNARVTRYEARLPGNGDSSSSHLFLFIARRLSWSVIFHTRLTRSLTFVFEWLAILIASMKGIRCRRKGDFR